MKAREVKCQICKEKAIVMRVGRHFLKCRCMDCRLSFDAPIEAPKPKEKKVKRPTRRTYAGLRGEKVGKGRRAEWHFTYPTKYAPLLLRATKYMGEWDVYFGHLRMGSGKTLVEGLEQAKRRMANNGHDLVV